VDDPSSASPSETPSPGSISPGSSSLITAWRVDKKKHLPEQDGDPGVFAGMGGLETAGRWNTKGRRISYAAEHQALAMLEKLVWLTAPEDAEGEDFILAPMAFDPERHVMTLPVDQLPEGWDGFPHRRRTRQIGDLWLRRGARPILKVPSAVLPTAYNYLINPQHRLFSELEQGDPIDITFDARLFYTPPAL